MALRGERMKNPDGEEVSGRYDVVVVGAGIMGSCIAYELARRGKAVLLLEQFEFLHHRGSSHGESRTIRATYPEEYYTEMMFEAYELWERAQRDAGYAVYRRTGQLDLGARDGNLGLDAVVASLEKYGVEHQVLAPAEVRERFPAVHLPEDWRAVYTERGGILHASKAVAMFQALAGKHGATLRDRAKVLNISADSAGGGVTLLTSRGSAVARKCVLAAGSWTGKLVKQLSGLELPITPLHTTLAYWAVDAAEAHLFSPEGGLPVFNVYSVPFLYGTPAIEYPRMIKVSYHSGTPCDPDTRTPAPDRAALQEFVAPWLRRTFHGLVRSDGPVIAEGCVYSMTPDEDFILDALPTHPDVLVAAGFSGHGFKLAPLVGRLMADLALHGSASGGAGPVPWMHHFRLRRFDDDPRGNVKGFGEQVVSENRMRKGVAESKL